ncbi:MAG: BF3164 family lipoprotein [Bacteroidales bacterium]
MKNLFFVYIFYISCCLLSSCKDASHPFCPERIYSIDMIESYSLGSIGTVYPYSILLEKDKILILDDGMADILKIINTKGELLLKFGDIGRGPGEFNQITSIDYNQTDSCFRVGVYDQGYKNYIEINENNAYNKLWESTLELDVVHRINNSQFICSALYDSTALYLLDNAGQVIDKSLLFPPKPDGIPLLAHSMACSGILAVAKNAAWFARSVVYDGGIDLFKIEGNKIIHKWRFSNFDMNYGIIKKYYNVPTPNENTKRGYLSICMGEDKIFALYSGRLVTAANSSEGNEIHVFDYDGNHVAKLISNKPLTQIAVSADQTKLFGINKQQEGEIMFVCDTIPFCIK